MNCDIDSEKSRLRTLLMRSHDMSPEEADLKLERSSISIHVAPGALNTPAGQAALVTSILLGARCFGKVKLSGDFDHDISAANLPLGASVQEVMAAVGATVEVVPSCRTLAIGPHQADISAPPQVELGWNGWYAYASPGQSKHELGDGSNALAGIAAAAMGLGSVFMSELGDPNAGRHVQEISLWSPGAIDDPIGPSHYSLPTSLWMIGLGNLGQAYLWCLSWLPYADPSSVNLMLQDFDKVSKENWGTSILVQRGKYGMLKTRAAEDWALHLGFSASRLDRRLDEHMRRAPTEPGIALVGLDKMAPRRLLGIPGFRHIIDSGLGSTVRNFREFRVNAFGEHDDPKLHFQGVKDRAREDLDSVLELPAYKRLLSQSTDGNCGVLTLAGQPIVLPFISALTAALAISQAIRIENGLPPNRTIVGRVNDMRNLRAVRSPA